MIRYVLVTVLLAVFFAGCAPKEVPVKSADMLSTPNLLAEADAAWKDKRYSVAELYYTQILERPDLRSSELPTVYSRLGDSAYRSGHYHQARIALENWANLDTTALNRWDWERTYLDTMSALGKGERLRNHLKWVQDTVRVPWETRREVALWYGGYFRARGDYERAMSVQAEFYAQAPDGAARAWLEEAVAAQFADLDTGKLNGVAEAIPVADQFRFPYVLAGFEHAARQADQADAWSASWRTMRNLSINAEIEDRAVLETRLTKLEEEYGVPRVGLALVLPLTGPYGKVGVKVLRGAGLAQWRLAQDGTDIDLKVINSAVPGWRDRLSALPGYYTVVGGPLRVDAFKQLARPDADGKNVLRQRAFFTFLASLGDLEEGKDAWRFFTSRNDEVRSLVDLTVQELGITDLAIFYPEEKFGRTMAETFYREASPLGGRIRGMQSYPPKELRQWGRRVGKLLKVPADFSEHKDAPLEQPDFGAVFVPDGWGQAQTLLPNFFFYEGDQLVFLGPGLWSRALDSIKDIDEHYYRLAICPGAWWEDSEGGQALQSALADEGLGQADFWVALGFDFVRFAGRFGTLPAAWTPDVVNSRIASAQDMDFSMARMTWSDQGVASQELYLFSPVRNGKQLVDIEKVTRRIEQAKARRERRVQAYEQRMEEEGKGKPTAGDAGQ